MDYVYDDGDGPGLEQPPAEPPTKETKKSNPPKLAKAKSTPVQNPEEKKLEEIKLPEEDIF